jgi:hypothetical protein
MKQAIELIDDMSKILGEIKFTIIHGEPMVEAAKQFQRLENEVHILRSALLKLL